MSINKNKITNFYYVQGIQNDEINDNVNIIISGFKNNKSLVYIIYHIHFPYMNNNVIYFQQNTHKLILLNIGVSL